MSTMEENIEVYIPSMGWDKGEGKEKKNHIWPLEIPP